ncbi:hypothetical protein JCM31447_11290 [Fluviispira sanaruensis]|uniref:Uncharacterized protein n=1 Tax=Fluviispira sanaruensis TaxID=2493639 RepID=A0A4P2VJJ4_FLUSA|nr:hypothetical protein JCM31447_11290 [Fluviispira sanaruensis]
MSSTDCEDLRPLVILETPKCLIITRSTALSKGIPLHERKIDKCDGKTTNYKKER